MDPQEKKYLDTYNHFAQGDVGDPFLKQAQQFIKDKKLEDDISRQEVHNTVLRLMELGISYKNIPELSFDSVKFNIDKGTTNDISNDFLKNIGFKDSGRTLQVPQIVGKGYNVLNDSEGSGQIFRFNNVPKQIMVFLYLKGRAYLKKTKLCT